MPRYSKKRTYKRSTKKYTPKKKSKPYRRYRSKQVKSQPVYSRAYAKLKYQYANNLTSNVNQYQCGTRQMFRLNDINRPLVGQAAGDALPENHYMYLQYFTNFKVTAAKVHIEVSPTNNTRNFTLVIQQMRSINTFDITNQTVKGIQHLDHLWTYQLSPDKPFKFNRYIPIHSMEGLTVQQLKDDFTQYQGQITATIANANTAAYYPARIPTFCMSLINNTDGTVAMVPYEVDITYYTSFTQRKSNLASSSA